MEDILDFDNHPLRTYSKRIGFSFGPIQRVVSTIFASICFFLSIIFPVFGLILTVFFAYAASSQYGFQIDANYGRFREYSKAFFIKRGKWQELSNYPDLAILTSMRGQTTFSMSNRSVSNTEKVYEVFLLSPSHRERVLVARFTGEEEAQSFASDFSKVNVRRFTKYSPKISERTRRRR